MLSCAGFNEACLKNNSSIRRRLQEQLAQRAPWHWGCVMPVVFERVPSRPWLSFSLRCGAVWGSVGNENGSASGKRLKDAHCLKTNWQQNVVLRFVSSDSLSSLNSTMRVSSNVSAWGSEQILHSGTHSSCCTSFVATTCWHRRRHIPISWVWVLSCLVSAREQNSCRV